MNPIRVGFSRRVIKEIERLNRKYPGSLREVEKLIEQIKTGEYPGDKMPNIGYHVYKVRLKNPSASRGKRGGLRIIYYVQIAERVILLTMYAKSEQTDISAQDVRQIISTIEDEILPNE